MQHEEHASRSSVLRGGVCALVGAAVPVGVYSFQGAPAVVLVLLAAAAGFALGYPGGHRFMWFRRGAVIAVVGTFPLAALCALVFRFPIPFVAYASGPRAVLPALGAVILYGVMGGFAVQGVVGGLAGMAAATGTAPSERSRWRVCVALSLGAAASGILLLSVLDYIIGPW